MTTLFIFTLICVFLSLLADRRKTFLGIEKGLKLFMKVLPSLLTILILVSIFLFLAPQEFLIKWVGRESGWLGFLIAAVVGSVSLIPGFIAYPLGAVLLKSGASYTVVAVFITTLMMVGILTLPLEIKYFGFKTSLLRNGLSFIAALIVGLLVGIFL